MEMQLTLFLTGEPGLPQRIPVRSARFTIGRAQDNDLVIDDPGLSRRHVLIESFDGLIQIADCGSQNGTLINGRPLVNTAFLQDGDWIAMGHSCEIEVSLTQAAANEAGAGAGSGGNLKENRLAAASAPASQNGAGVAPTIWMNPLTLALAAAGMILLVSTLLILSGRNARRTQTSFPDRVPAPIETNDNKKPESVTNPPAVDPASRQIDKLATAVMRSISREERSYAFSEKALDEIGKKVKQYSASPALLDGFLTIKQSGRDIAAEVQRGQAMEPALVIYTALAEAVSRQAGREVTTIARGVYKEMLEIRVRIGSDLADACLLDVAAYKMKSRTLDAILPRAVKATSKDRNVWFLHEQGKLSDEAYDFVLSFLAVGVIAQNPNQFGIASDPVP